MQAGEINNNDTKTRLARQRETTDKVINWLREEGFSPEDATRQHGNANYFARIVTQKGKLTEGGEIAGEEGFHDLFPKDKLDIVTISEVIALDRQTQKSYESLGATDQGILKQNRFYFDLQLALHQ